MFKAVISTLSLFLALTITTVMVVAQETQTPSMKIQVDIGMDHDADTPFAISCDVPYTLTPQESDDPFTLESDIIPVAVLSDVTQSASYDITSLILVPVYSAALSQSPSDEFATSAGHYSVALAEEDLNGDGLDDVIFYFQKIALFDTPETCAGASEILFNLEINTANGPVILSGSDIIAPQLNAEEEEIPEEPVSVAGVGLNFNKAYAMAQGSSAYQFVAQGTGISDMQVQVFGLDGKSVFDSGFVASNTLTWQGLSDNGTMAANGVYLYVITVKGFSGEIKRSSVNKLIILR